jgi:hypothetical protein
MRIVIVLIMNFFPNFFGCGGGGWNNKRVHEEPAGSQKNTELIVSTDINKEADSPDCKHLIEWNIMEDVNFKHAHSVSVQSSGISTITFDLPDTVTASMVQLGHEVITSMETVPSDTIVWETPARYLQATANFQMFESVIITPMCTYVKIYFPVLDRRKFTGLSWLRNFEQVCIGGFNFQRNRDKNIHFSQETPHMIWSVSTCPGFPELQLGHVEIRYYSHKSVWKEIRDALGL